jgi:hypothetical protein
MQSIGRILERMRWSWFLGLALMVAPCACEAEGTSVPARSGQRLKLYWYVFDDGTRQVDPDRFFDVVRQERCMPEAWTGGETLCTPIIGPYILGPPTFLAADCTDPVMDLGDQSSAPYIRTYVEGMVDRLDHLDEVTVDTYWTTDFTSGLCTGPFDGRGRKFYRVGAEVGRAELAPLHLRQPEASGRFALRTIESDDGLFVAVGLRDLELGSDCILKTSSATEAVCVPGDWGLGDVRYKDDECKVPVLVVPVGGSPPPRVLGHAGCDDELLVTGVVDTASPGFSRDLTGTCIASEVPAGTYFSLGPSPTPIGRLERRRGRSSGRLAPIELSAGNIRIPEGTLYDGELDAECSHTGDKEFTCRPIDLGYEHVYYRDGTCSAGSEVELAHVWPDPPIARCGGTYPPRFAWPPGFDSLHLVPIIDEREAGRVFRIDEGGVCTDTPYDGVNWPPLLYKVGPPVAVDALVTGRIVVDP